MNRRHALPIGVALALGLGACGKVQEAATEKAAEKMIESSISKDGTQAKVDLAQGGMKVSTTDASGKTTQMEMGNAKISEADLGLPFYPGSQPKEGSSMRIVNGGNQSLQMGLHSDDAPDKVAAFYRDKLKSMAEGKQLMDMSSNDGASISLVDDKAKSMLQVHVSKAEKGSDIAIVASREGPK
ncbi:MAG TPA: hypothetical protein VM845_11005 [Burkholderiaceae bacterium]|nr:hypothetical protein [Burkholderiaceae bacterium]